MDQTQFVVRHSFEGLDGISSTYDEARSYWDISRLTEERTPEYQKDLSNYLELAGTYFGLKLSEGILCGGILQVVHTAIRLFSENDVLPGSCQEIPRIDNATSFCIGREVDGLPLGLIVYAARNQWAHWDEEELRDPSKSVFGHLAGAHGDEPLWDLALDISNPTISVHANEVVVGLLGWEAYEDYEGDVREMLG